MNFLPMLCHETCVPVCGMEKHGGNSRRSSYALLSEFTLLELACLGWLGAVAEPGSF